jgi:hypothetical protein
MIMKIKNVMSVLALAVVVAAVASVNALSWKKTSLDLGNVTANESVDLTFEFTNVSSSAITILEAKGSCGCTQVEYPKEELKAGASAKITAKFQTGKLGVFKKTIQVKSSASDDYTVLSFSGTVVE